MPPRSPYPPGQKLSELERINHVSEGSCRPIVERIVIPNLKKPHPGEGTGVVMPAGGRYIRYAYASVKLLRALNSTIPVEIWYLGNRELPNTHARNKFDPLNVTFVDAMEVMSRHNFPYFHPWNAKIISVVYSPFQHVLLLDADCCPVIDPQRVFDSEEYQESGTLFFPDYFSHRKKGATKAMLALRAEPAELESGQLAVDKNEYWKELQLCLWMNRHKIFYKLELGDKNLYSLAFAKLNTFYWLAPRPTWHGWGMEHSLPDGTVAFRHCMCEKRGGAAAVPEYISELWREYDT